MKHAGVYVITVGIFSAMRYRFDVEGCYIIYNLISRFYYSLYLTICLLMWWSWRWVWY